MIEKESNSQPTVMVKKIIHADRERVFDAWTKPEMMKHWYVGAAGRSVSTVELTVGGKYTNNMFITGQSTCNENQGSEKEEKCYFHHGEYLEIKRPEKIVFTWNSPSPL